MSTIVARTGRHRQRYDNNLRLVSGCIPYRLVKDDEGHCINLEKRVEVLMISSPNRDDMVFPKGGWENDETIEEAACREALEEAGVRGILRETPLGVWEFRSKSNQEVCSPGGGCKGCMFALEVTEELDDWPEQNNRERKWLLTSEALEVCRYEWMRSALEKFMGVILGEKDKREHEMSKEEVLGGEVEPPKHHPVAVVVSDDQECQIMPTNCHLKPSNAPMNSSFGIVLPAGIFL